MSLIAVGAYDGVVYCFSLNIPGEFQGDDFKGVSFDAVFTDDNHNGAIKSLAFNQNYLASSSSDESVRLFDIKKMTDAGTIIKVGCVNSLTFGGKYLITSSSDGYLRIFNPKTNDLVKEIKAHNSVKHVSLYSNSAIALILENNKKIKLYNLISGKLASSASLTHDAEKVIISPNGTSYIILFTNFLVVCRTKDSYVQKLQFTKTIHNVDYIKDDVIVIGGESKYLSIFNIFPCSEIVTWQIDSNRTRDLKVLEMPKFGPILMTIHSTGELNAWDIRNLENKKPKIIATIKVPSRPVCCSACVV